MMMPTRAGSLVACALTATLITPMSTSAQVVAGTLLESGFDRVISHGSIALLQLDRTPAHTVRVSFDGSFELRAPQPGSYLLYALAFGYKTTLDGPFQLAAGDTLAIEFRLEPEPFAMDSLSVTVTPESQRLERAGFYDRQRASLGHFITEIEIRERNPIETTDIFRFRPGMTIRPTAGGSGLSKDMLRVRRGCIPQVYVDGLLIRDDALRPRGGQLYINDLLRPGDIAGIEVYRSPLEIPAEYGGRNGACGVVVFWTH